MRSSTDENERRHCKTEEQENDEPKTKMPHD